MLNEFNFDLLDETPYEEEEKEDKFSNMDLSTNSSYEDIELTPDSSFKDAALTTNSSYEDLDLTGEDTGYVDLDNLNSSEDISDVQLQPTFELTTLGEDYSVANLAKHKGVVDMINSYLGFRIGEEGRQAEGETDEDVIEKMLSHFRYVEGNTIDTFQEVDFLKDEKTSKQTKDNFLKLYTMYQEIPNFASEGGGSFFAGASDVLTAAIFDPATVVGLGLGGPIGAIVGSAVKQAGKGAATRTILRHALKGNLGKITAMTSVEGLLGAMGESQRQEMKIEVGMMGEKDYATIGTMGAVSGVASLVGFPLGVGAAKKGLAAAGVRSGDDVLRQRLADAKISSGKVLDDKKSLANFDPVTGELFDVDRAKRVRDSLGMPNAPLTLGVQNDISSLVTQAVGNLMEDMPEKYFLRDEVVAAVKKAPGVKAQRARVEKEKVSTAVIRIMSGSDDINEDVLERALAKTGLTVAEFSQLERLGVQESAKQMQHYSALANRIKKMGQDNPALKKQIDALYKDANDTRSVFGTMTGFVKRLDRETRAMMVSQISTTARNVISAAAYLTFGAASKLIESTVYHTAKATSSALNGNASIKGVKQGLEEIVTDAFSTLGQIVMPKQNKELADMMLQNNARISNTLFRTMQETGDQDLSRVTKWMNGLNMAQDQVIRSGVFTDSVNQQMKKLDLDMYDYIANNKSIPVEVLNRATDDALEATFAVMPPEGLAHHFVKFVERLPFMPVIGTHQFPFARFMADAMTFQYRYSPLNFFNAASVGTQGAVKSRSAKKALASGNLDMFKDEATLKAIADGTITEAAAKNADDAARAVAETAVLQGRQGVEESVQRISKATVGSAALYAAYLYRDENQDSAWYNMIDSGENNKPIDIRAVFPMAPYLAVADLLVKWKNGELDSAEPATQLLTGIAGTQFRPSQAQDFIGDLFEQLAGIGEEGDVVTKEKLGKTLGDWAGSIAGRPFTAAQIGRDVYAAFDESEAIVRETRMVKGDGFQEVFSNQFMNHLKSKVPVWQKDLPEFRSPTTGGTVRRQSAAMAQFSGVKYLPAPSEVERELAKQGIESYKLNPRTGNKLADYYTKKHMPPYVDMLLGYTIGSGLYKSQPKWKQKEIIKSVMSEVTTIAKGVAEGEVLMDAVRQGKSISVFDKGRWASEPESVRRHANEYYRLHYGKSVVEMGAYAAGIKIGRALKGSM
tara:strand:+ start:5272 stop:8859 length:3588 start_codon:yes stop_codon:yes gene_type:complete